MNTCAEHIQNRNCITTTEAHSRGQPEGERTAAPEEHAMALKIQEGMSSLCVAATRRPEVWEKALASLAPKRPTQIRRAFRDYMTWDDEQRSQAMAALEGAIDWAKSGRHSLLEEVVTEFKLSPRFVHAIVTHWPESEFDAIGKPYNHWRNSVNALVTKYQRLAFKLANQFQARAIGEGDWVSHAFFALIKAAEMYDDPGKAEFMTFAYRWIQFDLKKAYEREPDHKSLTSFVSDTHSENRSALGDEEDCFVGLVPGPNRQFVAINRTKEISAAIAVLTERERVVIKRLYGLNEREEEITADEISKDLGVTRARIYQIRAQALAKMQKIAA